MSDLEQRAWCAEGKELRPVPCGLCGCERSRPLARENGLDVVACDACGLVYVTPQPSRAELERFYTDYYRAETEDRWREIMQPVFERDARRLLRVVGPRARILDIGTGFGHFLDVLRAQGFEVEGLEVSPLARERLAARGIAVHDGLMPDVDLEEASYDAITASSVLEHVADPLGFLRKAHALLRPGGVLFVRVPNIGLLRAFFLAKRYEHVPAVRRCLRVLRREIMDEETLFHVIDPPGHLFGFDARTLAAGLARAGFARTRVEADPMQARGTWLNRAVDGGVYVAARVLRAATGGAVLLSPNVSAWAWR